MKGKITMIILAGCLSVTALTGCGKAGNNKITSSTGTEHEHTWTAIYETVHHDATGHYEDIGHYENVVTDYNGDECVYTMHWVDNGLNWIKDTEAYSEEVIDHYECPCGAIRW